MAEKGPRRSCAPAICPTVEVGGGGRERGSGDRCCREVGEAASVWCGEVMVTPRRMVAKLLGQQE